jgi:hypothetical protein
LLLHRTKTACSIPWKAALSSAGKLEIRKPAHEGAHLKDWSGAAGRA